ncbi:methylated-DNA--[protein]-cysteine S-methyltransferase [Bdellovibrio bacteriovorus]|uniref:methylated-DNA--[protein]-cysteine S-methyltransferase n=1 Tax=Bdellovibrio bacteriovorus TaxID=959 RepID=UPI0021CEFE10|nr:methylated-DNA--[protein]-cysteine S-methyltransferase [Bdellovibrio bacteriovorus]UXR66064.1 methylated-DNA--[protein]-cysteine S-methyltransferase [Bdellovibrio bacteriovorus]
MTKAQLKIKTHLGDLYLVASPSGLQSIFWTKSKIPMLENPQSPEGKILRQTESQLQEYLQGQRRKFDLPLDLKGTEFQKKVWKELLKIPYGKTTSYKQLATVLGSPQASRAVGTANGKNPVCIVVPCHRVINTDGGLGGYSGGLKIKSQLLQLEQGRT